MLFSEGTRLGPYQITAPIGAGGMGEVYKAYDTRLDRTVALKVLSETRAGDVVAQQRFTREARAIAALSHPRICPLFDVGHHDGVDFLVMEYLEGETLSERLVSGPMPVDRAIKVAREIAEALAAAHAAGIVHRDLKPGNVMLTKSGTRLLDFGLAKLRPATAPLTDLADTDTRQPVTRSGALPGTLQYMAPEQLEGRDADPRSDIFAFGALFYEMITGRRAFEGRAPATVIAAILHVDPPPPSSLVPSLSPAIDQFIGTCLRKQPDDRWQSVHDMSIALRWIAQEGLATRRAAASPAAGAGAGAGAGWWAALIVALAALSAGAVLWRSRPAVPTLPSARFDVALPDHLGFDWPDWPNVSPDGRRLVFTARHQGIRSLWMRSLDGTVQPLSGTEGATYPFWSPDSRTVAFFAGGKLKRVDVTGGPVATLADAFSVGRGSWAAGTILFVPRQNGPIHAVPDGGGSARAVTRLDAANGETGHQFPRLLPDGRRFLFTAAGRQPGVYVASLDTSSVTPVLRSYTATAFVPPGFLLFNRQRTLMAQAFEPATAELRGTPVEIAEPVAGAAFSASDNGTLVVRPGGGSPHQLTWIGRDGRRGAIVGEPAHYQQLVLSPSGRRAAVQRVDTDDGNADLWVVDLDTGITSRMTTHAAMDGDPAWAPDERSLVFTSYRSGPGTAWLWDFVSGRESPYFDIAASAAVRPTSPAAATPPTALAPARIPEGIAVDDWTRDGRYLVVRTFGQALYLVPTAGDRVAQLMADTPYVEDQSQVSPDGRWIAFNSDESGRWEVYVARFPDVTDRRQVSSAGGVQPRWRRDSGELYYLSLDGVVMAAAVEAGGRENRLGAPRALFRTQVSPSPNVPQYDVTADGQRFLVLEPARSGGEPVTFVLNWTSGLTR
jgi:Tol biopolymer transport system component